MSPNELTGRIATEAPELLVGVGTILTADRAAAARDAGAEFGVVPGFSSSVVEAARRIGLPFPAGVATPSEIEAAVAAGCRLLKLFHAEPLGGVPYLNAIAVPYRHLGLGFIPLGGVNANNADAYAECPHVTAIGGSWIAPADLIGARDWPAIRDRAADAVRVCCA